MNTPLIYAMTIDGTPVIRDEFAWAPQGRNNLTWRVVEVEDGELTAISVATLDDEEFAASELATDARVFTLSIEEVARLMPQDAERVPEGENRNWWLRDAGGAEGFRAYVHNNGWINEYGAEAGSGYAAQRPAIKLAFGDLQFALPNENAACEEPYVTQSAEEFLAGKTPTLFSERGEELMLEAHDGNDIFALEDYLRWFGVHHSWETMLADTLEELAQAGDSTQINRLLDMCNGIEFMGSALAAAMSEGHIAVAGTLIRAGALLDGGLSKTRLLCDTPELRRMRKQGYLKEAEICENILSSEQGSYSIKTLVRQNLVSGKNFHALLRAASKSEQDHELFEWLVCPDYKPLKRAFVSVVKKKVHIASHPQGNSVAASDWALQLLWYPQLVHDNPSAARALSTHLRDSSMEGKRELICFLARENCQEEIETILAGKKVYSPKDIAAAIEAASAAGHKKLANYLKSFLKSVGAGKLVAGD